MPGNATRRMLQRSIIFPRTGTAMAPRIPPTDNAKDVVLRIHPVSAMIGLRNTPNVKPRTGPLQTNNPVTAPTTTHHGLVNFSPMTGLPPARCRLQKCGGDQESRSTLSRVSRAVLEGSRVYAE